MSNPPTNNVDKTSRDRPDDAKPAQQQQGQSDKAQQQQGGSAAAPTQPVDPAPIVAKT
jgi:hypothetical protein